MAEAFLSAAAAKSPAVAGTCAELGGLYTKKLWHQLTDKLEEVTRTETLHADGFLLQLYAGFVQEIEPKLNALRLAHLAVVVSGHYAERAQSIAFLEATITRLKQAADDGGRGAGSTMSGGMGVGGARAAGLADAVRRASEPALYLQMQVALLTLQGGGIAEAKTMLDAGVTTLEGLTDVDPSVHASVHHTACLLHKAKQEFAAFYRSGTLYLAYISVDSLDPITRMALAVDLSLAALLGEDIYSFGELLSHPVLKQLQLEGSGYQWLHQLLVAFNTGDLEAYEGLCATHAAELSAQPALVASAVKLREKITILCLMEIIFALPAENRVISLALIAQKTKLSPDGVEFLLMKTLSAHLIEGVINQVEGTVSVSWVQPRVLGLAQIGELRGRLNVWLDKVHTTLVTVESETPELIAAM